MNHPWWEYRRDQEFSEREERLDAIRARIVREQCPNPSCMNGKVEVRDGTAFPALAICGVCCGRGYYLVEKA